MVSFIVPAHNEAQLIGRTLTSLHAAGQACAEPYEIVVASDSSTDGTDAIAALHEARVVQVEVRHIAAARNAGARRARGSFLIFVDADTVVPASTVEATLAAWRGGAVGGGASVYLDGRLPLAARVLMPAFRMGMRTARLAAGCYLFCTRAAFDSAGGFDTHLFAGEELALSRRLRRQGPFVVLRNPVISSGRKLRTHSVLDVGRLLVAAASRGPAVLANRDCLGLWYGDRQVDPEGPDPGRPGGSLSGGTPPSRDACDPG